VDVRLRPFQDGDEAVVRRMIVGLREHVAATDPIARLRPSHEAYVETEWADIAKAMGDGTGCVFLAEDGGASVGYVFGRVRQQTAENLVYVVPSVLGLVVDLYVAASHRSRGVGSQLLERMEGELRDRGCDHVWVNVFAPNALAADFYDRRGYAARDVGLIKKLGG
jgi:GNAT superfamily N-acetyltransferase